MRRPAASALLLLCLPALLIAADRPGSEALALWRLDKGAGRYAKDVVAKRVGVTHGNVTWVDGKSGKALQFDGKTGKFAVSAQETFTVPPGRPFTIDLWVRVAPDGLKNTQQVFHGRAGKGQHRLQMEIRRKTGVVWLTLGRAGVRNSRTNIADGKWHHLAGIRDVRRKRLVLAVDGVEDASAECDVQQKLIIPWSFILGGESAGGTAGRREECLNGAVDELRLSFAQLHYQARSAPDPAPAKVSVQTPTPPPNKPVTRNKPVTQKLSPLSSTKIAEKQITNSVGMKLIAIAQGDFDMGSSEAWNTEPVHRVRITKPFYIGAHEVTQAQFKAVMGFSPSAFTYKAADHPVDSVSWFQAVEFCKRLGAKEGVTYRLPFEAEWEYACRAGTATTYFFGDDPAKLGDYAWVRAKHVSNTQEPRPVGTRKPNPWRLYDMIDGVSEWCADWYHPLYYKDSPLADPAGPDTSYITQGAGARTHRGDGWVGWTGRVTRPRYTSAFRDYASPESKSRKIGFRIVREIQ